jgi:hypothetical protein
MLEAGPISVQAWSAQIRLFAVKTLDKNRFSKLIVDLLRPVLLATATCGRGGGSCVCG